MFYIYRYARWDGTQQVFELDDEALMDELSEDLMAHGDVWRALRKPFQRGVRGRDGDSLEGLTQLMERLRDRRQESLQRYNLDSLFDDIKERLREVVQTEREGIDRRLLEAQEQEMLEQWADRNREHLDDLPESPGGAIKELSDYEFMDPQAQRQFQELLEALKQQMLQNNFQNMKQLKGVSFQDMAGLRQMSRDLNQMLQDQMTGREPNYQQFMALYGSLFGENQPQNQKELMDQLAHQMAQMQSLLGSMSPETRRELEDMMDSLLDQEMLDDLAKLTMAMGQIYPLWGGVTMDNLRSQYSFLGEESLNLEQAMELMGQLQGLDELERQIQDVMQWGNIDDLDLDKVEALLGEEARRAVEQLKRVTEMLEEAGYVKRKGSKLELTPRGIRKIGQKALREVFARLKRDRLRQHELQTRGNSGEDTGETKPYEFGDPFDVDLRRSVMNSITRSGPQVPVSMAVEDFEILRPEEVSQVSTCLLLDQSRSMGRFGSFLAAKKVALALYTLIQGQFPRDKFYVIGFSDYAAELKGEYLPEITWNGSATNMQHAFMLSRKLLSKQKIGTRQIIIITDGEPTARMEGRPDLLRLPTQLADSARDAE